MVIGIGNSQRRSAGGLEIEDRSDRPEGQWRQQPVTLGLDLADRQLVGLIEEVAEGAAGDCPGHSDDHKSLAAGGAPDDGDVGAGSEVVGGRERGEDPAVEEAVAVGG